MVKYVQAHGLYKSPSVIFLSFSHYVLLSSLFPLSSPPHLRTFISTKICARVHKAPEEKFSIYRSSEFRNCTKHFLMHCDN